MKNMVMAKKGQDPMVTYIKARIKQNLNFIAIAEGQTGAGKSWAMLSLAYMIDPTFDVSQVAFSFRDVMKIINDPDFKKKKWKVILFDEAQTDINNRAWQSLTNRLMLYLTSTFRHQNIILLFATPYADFIDSATMKLIHCKYMIKGTDRKNKVGLCRPKLQQYNPKMKKFYEHSLMITSPRGTIKLTDWRIPRPPQHLVIPYEEKKTEFTSQLNQEIERMLEMEFEKKQEKITPLTDEDEINKAIIKMKKQEDRDRYIYVVNNPYKKRSEYATEWGVDPAWVTRFTQRLTKLGVDIYKYL